MPEGLCGIGVCGGLSESLVDRRIGEATPIQIDERRSGISYRLSYLLRFSLGLKMNTQTNASGGAEPVGDYSAPISEQTLQVSCSKSCDIHELRVARHMAQHGLRCVPLVKGSKVPRKGFAWKTMATTSAEVLEREFSGGQYDVGVIPGSANFLVLDIDTKKGKRGDLSLELLEAEHGNLSGTLTQITKSGGKHLWFRLPSGVQVGNSVKQLEQLLGEGHGIDVRGHAGLVVVGAEGYDWDTTDGMFSVGLVFSIPPSFLSLLSTSSSAPSATPASATRVSITPIDAITNRGDQTREVAFQGEQAERDSWEDRVEECIGNRLYQSVREGERNSKLIRFVGELKRLHGCPTDFPEDVFQRWHRIAQSRGSRSPVADTLSAARHLWNNYCPSKSAVERAAAIAKGQRIRGYEAPDEQHELCLIYEQLKDSEGISYVPQRHLCKLLHCHKQTIRKYQEQLCEDGYLVLVEDYKPHSRCKRYKVIDKCAVDTD